MTIKQQGGIFGRNPTFNDVDVEGTLTVNGEPISDFGTMAQQDADAIAITGGAINGTVIGGSTSAAGTFTAFTSTGIDDNATSTAITIDADENVGIGTGNPSFPLTISKNSPASEIMFFVGNTKYSSTSSSGDSKIKFGWANHGAADITAYKASTNTTGFKFHTELGFNVANLALTIDPSGSLTPTGNLIVGSGNGIDFSATSGTGTSELFDDYEEGTWTGTLTSATPPTTPITATGYYTKVGDVVTAIIAFRNVNNTGASGAISVTGLPYSSNSGAVSYSNGSAFMSRSSYSNGLVSYITPASTTVSLVDYNSNAVSWASTGAGVYGNVQIIYKV